MTYNELSRRRLLGMFGVGASAAFLAACGADSSSGPKSSPSGSTSTAPPQLAADRVDGPTLKVWCDAGRIPAFLAVSKGFTKQYSVNVEFQPISFLDLLNQYKQAAPTGNGPDLVDCNFDWTQELLSAGLITAIDLGAKAAEFDKRSLDGYTIDGKLYGYPTTLETTCVFRNTDLIPEPVGTWAQFEQVAADLSAKGAEHPFIHVPNSYVYNAMLTGFGGYLYPPPGPDGAVDYTDMGYDNAGALAALTYFDMLVKKGWMQPGVDDNVMAEVFATQGGLLLSGPWNAATLDAAGANYSIDKTPDGPAGPARPYLSARGLMVNKFGEQQALAQTYLTEYLATEEVMLTYATEQDQESAWTSAKNVSASDTVKAMIAAGENAIPIPSDGAFTAFFPPATEALELIQTQQTTPEKALVTLRAKFEEAWS